MPAFTDAGLSVTPAAAWRLLNDRVFCFIRGLVDGRCVSGLLSTRRKAGGQCVCTLHTLGPPAVLKHFY